MQRQGILNWSYLLIRTVEVSHGGKPSIVDRIGEDRPSLLLVGPFRMLLSINLTGRFARTSSYSKPLP